MMDWCDKDNQSLAPKKVTTLIDKAYYYRTTDRHEFPVQRSLNSYSYDWFGSSPDRYTLPNRQAKGGETGVDSNSHITGFSPAILKKWERNLAAISNPAPKKAVKPAKAVFRPVKNSSPQRP
jgi:hypothetical protein